jgi:hypothetical protein
MATFYVGPRPVLRGQSTATMVNPYFTMTGKAKGTGTYSYYPLYSSSQLLTGAPDNDHTPGTGRHPGNVLLSQLFTGSTLYAGTTPLAGAFPDGKATYDGARFKPFEYKGLTGAQAFGSGFGHAADRVNPYALYSNYFFDGVTSANVFASGYGHGPRTEAQGAAASFGLFRPTEFIGVTSAKIFTDGYGQPNTSSDYGRNKVREYKGLASAKAL